VIPCALASNLEEKPYGSAINEKCLGIVRGIGDPPKGGINSRGRVVSGSAKVNSLNGAPCGTRIKRAIKRTCSRLGEHEHPPNIQKGREMSRGEKREAHRKWIEHSH